MTSQNGRPAEYEDHCFTSFTDAAVIVDQFERDLESLGISVASGSDLEVICLNILDLEPQRQGQSEVDLLSDCRPIWRRTVGLVDLLRHLNHAKSIGRLAVFESHLRLLNQGVAAQNVRVLSDDACNKIFEMLIALFCLPIAETVELDDPNRSQGDNPDVLATIDGVIWGFACKTPNGPSPKTMFERMKEGIEQIEVSPAQRGAVYFNFRNVIDHERTWPSVSGTSTRPDASRFTFRIWQTREPIESYFRYLVDEKNSEMLDAIGPQNVQNVFVGGKCIPGAMVFLQTAAAVQSSDGPFVGTVGIPALMEFGDMDPADMQLLQRIQFARRDSHD